MHDIVLQESLLKVGKGNRILREGYDHNYCLAKRDKKIESIGHIICHFLFIKLSEDDRFYFHYYPRSDKEYLFELRRVLQGLGISNTRLYNFYQANPYNIKVFEQGELYRCQRRLENEDLAEMLSQFRIQIINVPFINTNGTDYANNPGISPYQNDKFDVLVKNDIVIISTGPQFQYAEVARFDLSTSG